MTLNKTVDWFKQAVPNPDNKTLSVQLGCHIEEFCELLDTLSLTGASDDTLTSAFDLLRIVSMRLKNGSTVVHSANPLPMLDALADGIVTAAGLAYMQGMDIDGALAEVNRSNFSKFENGKPVFLEGGKIGKGKDYVAPNLNKFIGGGHESK